jgi:hypothetical protein
MNYMIRLIGEWEERFEAIRNSEGFPLSATNTVKKMLLALEPEPSDSSSKPEDLLKSLATEPEQQEQEQQSSESSESSFSPAESLLLDKKARKKKGK